MAAILPVLATAILTLASIVSWILVLLAVKGAESWKSVRWKTTIALILAVILVTQVSFPVAQLAFDLSQMLK